MGICIPAITPPVMYLRISAFRCLPYLISPVFPLNAIIKEVKVDFTNFDTMGNPFSGLGCLRIYPHTYRPLSAGDYKSQAVSGAVVHWCTLGEISTFSVESDLADYLQSGLGNSYMPVRLQFNELETDGDNVNDLIGFIATNLNVKYEAP